MKSLSSRIAIPSIFILLALMSSAPFASDRYIRGQISHQGRPAAGAGVTISCADGPIETNSYGHFRATLHSATGCTLKVSWDGRPSESVTLSGKHMNRFVNLNLQRYGDRWLIDIR